MGVSYMRSPRFFGVFPFIRKTYQRLWSRKRSPGWIVVPSSGELSLHRVSSQRCLGLRLSGTVDPQHSSSSICEKGYLWVTLAPGWGVICGSPEVSDGVPLVMKSALERVTAGMWAQLVVLHPFSGVTSWSCFQGKSWNFHYRSGGETAFLFCFIVFNGWNWKWEK